MYLTQQYIVILISSFTYSIMASASSAVPGGLAAPDDQGNLGFCSRYALGKAAANGFMEGKFAPHQQLDFVQRDIATAIVNADEVKVKH